MCGIFGIIGKEPVAEYILQGLHLLQHRGQDATGIFTYNPDTRKHSLYKDRGLVNQVFHSPTFHLPEAYWGIGHLRYSTVGKGNIEDIQPHIIQKGDLTIAMVHNGNIVNYIPLKNQLMSEQIAFQTGCDTEVILHIFANKISTEACNFESICEAVSEVYTHIFGAYSILVLITGVGVIAFRDPWGFRPLLYGKSRNQHAYVFTSETGPISYVETDNMRDVDPGEVIFIDKHHKVHHRHLKQHCHTHCSFEFNYFAKPNAIIEKREVYQIRAQLGLALARNVQVAGLDIDVVVPIPTTAHPSALALGRALNIPVEEGFIKQSFVGRTFIMPTQNSRKKAVSDKLTTVRSVFKNKNVLLVDDSIVRGNVSKHVIDMARKAQARRVYFASTYPPVRYPCFYGIDFPRQEELIAWEKNYEEISREIGADAVIYNSVEDMKNAIGIDDLCTACLTGKYPTKTDGASELQYLRLQSLNQMELIGQN